MARRIYLHIGTMKSATTYLQALCNLNADLLSERGLLWLGSGANYSAVADFYGSRQTGPSRAMRWPEFASRIREHDAEALISNELLCTRGPDKVAALLRDLGDADIQVVITARDLGRVIGSQWQERARNRTDESWSSFMDSLMAEESDDEPAVRWFWRRQDHSAIVANYAQVVGGANITLVTVPRAGSERRLVAERFFAAVGCSNPGDLREPNTANPSLGSHSVELVRRVQQRLPDGDRERLRMVVKYVLSRRVLALRRPYEPAVGLTPDQFEWARQRASDDIDRLRTSGVRVVGDLAELEPSEPLTAVGDPGSATDGELLDAALDAVVGLLDTVDLLARLGDYGGYGDVVRRLGRREDGGTSL